jgi:hypothetical protein
MYHQEDRMASRLLLLVFIVSLTFPVSSLSQQACRAEFSVGVIGATGDSFRGLGADDFTARAAKSAIAIKSVSFDDGPRRVLFVVDNGKKINSNIRKVEIEMVNAMMAAGRPGDTFALIATHGVNRTAKFGEERANLTSVLAQEVDSKSGATVGALDALMEGMQWFGAPANGDAIVVIAAELEGSHKANPKAVAKALAEHRIRMFGLALGPVATKSLVAGGTMTSTTSQGLAYTTPGIGDIVYNTGDENFFPLTSRSGGLVLGVLGGSRQAYNLEDPKVKQMLGQKARQVYSMIGTFYRVEIAPPQLSHPEDIKVDVVERIHKIAPQMWLLYPVELGPC